ncbi:MAG: DNA-3-methyladenine glycosylase [Pseudobdellovibrionaceae bacterium]
MLFDAKNFQKGKRLLAKDPAVKALFARHRGLQFAPKMERVPFESLVRAIAHQQLHGKAAETILGRMIALFPEKPFPEPKDLLKISEAKLRACGFSYSKIKSIKDIAEKTISGVVPSAKAIVSLPNDEIVERLTEIFGVGRWTVEMLLIFQLGRLDVWPIDDFGIRRGFQVWKKKKEMPTAKELKKYQDQWAPYQTIISLYLWREADKAKE